jgi:hypothetical protein
MQKYWCFVEESDTFSALFMLLRISHIYSGVWSGKGNVYYFYHDGKFKGKRMSGGLVPISKQLSDSGHLQYPLRIVS